MENVTANTNIRHVKKTNFLAVVGKTSLYNRQVIAYNTSHLDYIMLIAETTAGNILTIIDDHGHNLGVACTTITRKEYEEKYDGYVGTKVLSDAFEACGLEYIKTTHSSRRV